MAPTVDPEDPAQAEGALIILATGVEGAGLPAAVATVVTAGILSSVPRLQFSTLRRQYRLTAVLEDLVEGVGTAVLEDLVEGVEAGEVGAPEETEATGE